jgi:hypothetical protein
VKGMLEWREEVKNRKVTIKLLPLIVTRVASEASRFTDIRNKQLKTIIFSYLHILPFHI